MYLIGYKHLSEYSSSYFDKLFVKLFKYQLDAGLSAHLGDVFSVRAPDKDGYTVQH